MRLFSQGPARIAGELLTVSETFSPNVARTYATHFSPVIVPQSTYFSSVNDARLCRKPAASGPTGWLSPRMPWQFPHFEVLLRVNK
jgi:hypothetical protein